MIDYATSAIPEPLRSRLANGESILVVARASGQGGKEPRYLAVRDLKQALAHLSDISGIDYSALPLPDDDELVELLRTAQPVGSTGSTGDLRLARSVTSKGPDGRSFKNTFVELDFRADFGLYLLVSTGSAKKLDENLDQPFGDELERVSKRVGQALLFGKRADRWSRKPWAMGGVMIYVESTDCWLGTDEDGIMRYSSEVGQKFFGHFSEGERAASRLPKQTRDGMSSKTKTKMVNGRCLYGFPMAPPPGFTTLRPRERSGVGDQIIVLDGPAWHPSDDEVAYGIPEVRNADGARVDQVENVRFILRRLGRKEWPIERLGAHMIQRMFSTTKLRRDHGPAAVCTNPDSTRHTITQMAHQLDVYEKGTWTIQSGVAGVPPVTITGLLPDGMPWASKEDFARIRRWRAAIDERAGRRSSTPFSGLPAHVNGTPATLTTYRPADAPDRPALRPIDATHGRKIRGHAVPGANPLDVATFAESIVQSLVANADAPLDMFGLPEDVDAVPDENAIRLDNARRDLAAKTKKAEQLWESCLQAEGAAKRRYEDEYNQLDSEVITLQEEVDRLERFLEDAAVRKEQVGMAPRQLLRIVASLRDPFDITFRNVWKDCIRDLTITHQRVNRWGCTGVEQSWSGVLVFSGEHGSYSIPFQGEVTLGALAKVEKSAAEAIAQMRAGVPLWQIKVPHIGVVRDVVCRLLGVEPKHFILANCRDGRITKTAMASVYPPGGDRVDLAAVALELGEDEEFVRRVHEVHSTAASSPPRWLGKNGPIGTVHALAATHEGRVHASSVVPARFKTWATFRSVLYSQSYKKQWSTTASTAELKPCPFCRSLRRGPMRIPEVSGLVCLDCRKDSLGIVWPANPYDRYLTSAESFYELGLLDHMPSDPNGDPTINWRDADLPRNRPLNEIPAETRAAVIQSYESGDKPVTQLMEQHSVTQGELYAIIDNAGVARRSELHWTRGAA